jgi:hypothetical protein
MKRMQSPAADVADAAFDDGVRVLLDAEQLGKSDDGLTSALTLGRAALRHLVRATLLDRGLLEPSTSDADLWRAARLLPVAAGGSEQMGWAAGTEDWFERFVASPTGDLALAELPNPEQASLLKNMVSLGFTLFGPLDEARYGAARRRMRRRSRLLLGGALVLLALGLGLWRALAPPNLAFEQPVVAVDTLADRDPRLLVDGDKLGLGFHSTYRRDPYATIDLGKVHRVSRIEIFNRPDCCQERAVPLDVQLSVDGKNFSTIRREKHSFFELTVRTKLPTPARYVRLQHVGTEHFHLSEVEVY